PDMPSLPENETVSGWLYQPFASGVLLAVPVTVGGVASYLNETAALAVFPALSWQLPETFAVASSGPLYVGAEQLARPDMPSIPENETDSAWLYQPFASGVRPALPRTVGAVASYGNESAPVPVLPALSRQVP